MGGDERIISILGLGPMGFRVAELFVEAGFQTIVWNRTFEKASPLTARGATVVRAASDAIAASRTTIAVLATAEALKNILEISDLAGKTIVNLGSASQQETKIISKLVQDCGGEYVSGSIYANPSNLSTGDSAIIYSGRSSLTSLDSFMGVLSPTAIFIGDDPEHNKILSLSICTQMYIGIMGFLEGARLAQTVNVSAAAYANFVISLLGPFYRKMITNLGTRIDEGNLAGDESMIGTEAHIANLVRAQFGQAGLKSEGMELFSSYIDRAIELGQRDNGIAALYDVIHRR
jgi:3-hydroxyisobutyrate dehydrogenase-like beta-hydroxyacid dehydrogenase